MIDITNPDLRFIYFAAAMFMSIVYGIGAFKIHRWKKSAIPDKWLPLLHQYWLNTLCALAGWLAGWVVLNRWLACPSFMCADEPKIATAILALAAIVGMTGLLPLTIMNGIGALQQALASLLDRNPKSEPPRKPIDEDLPP